MVEIYALTDPRTGERRYIGKANDSKKRLASHIRDSRRRDTPVYRWIKKLTGLGFVPGLEIIGRVESNWQELEIQKIDEAKAKGARLLNVAKGGDEPFCPAHIRAENGRKNAATRNHRMWSLMRGLGQALKAGWVSKETKDKIRARPDVFASVMHLL